MSTTIFFKSLRALNRLHQGPLGDHIDDFAALLQVQGYSGKSAIEMLRVIADFSRWLATHRLDVHDVDNDRLRSFLVCRKRTRSVGRSDRCALQKFLNLLQEKGVVDMTIVEVPLSQSEQVNEDFARYLLQERGLSPATPRIYLPIISHFLAERFADGTCPFDVLAPTDIIGFVARHAREQSHSKAQLLVKALRAFLRYLLHKGKIATDLAACVPTVAKWSHAELPKFLTPDQVNQVLNHCDRKTAEGRRDYTILLLLARLGLRAGEVAALTFDQINWEQGYLTIRAKSERFADGTCPFDVLAPTDIIGFVARHAREQSHSKAQLLVKALRAFLRYLLHKGKIATDLAACVPTVAKWSHAELPKFLTPDQVNQVLNHCDRKTAEGRRDYAILLLLARLGLRAGEVAALTFDQINWEQGYMTIRAKGGRWTQLPLLADVGEAITQYLMSGRAICNDRHVFIRAHAPRCGFATSTAISGLVKRAFVRAGLALPCNGAHLFRHSLATHMLRQGGSLFDIAQVLRHRQFDTTRIYAKVDLCALRALALPWPGEHQ